MDLSRRYSKHGFFEGRARPPPVEKHQMRLSNLCRIVKEHEGLKNAYPTRFLLLLVAFYYALLLFFLCFV
jgi:hypothetical protein